MEQLQFDGMERRTLLEAQSPEQLRELRVNLLMRLSELESEVHLINDVLEGMGYE